MMSYLSRFQLEDEDVNVTGLLAQMEAAEADVDKLKLAVTQHLRPQLRETAAETENLLKQLQELSSSVQVRPK